MNFGVQILSRNAAADHAHLERRINRFIIFTLQPRDQIGGRYDLADAADAWPLPQMSFQVFGRDRSPDASVSKLILEASASGR